MTLEFDALLRSESARFLSVIEPTPPDAVVPTCPEWTADDLLWHLAEVQHFWAAIVGGRLASPESYLEPERPGDRGDLLSFFNAASAGLTEALAGAEDHKPAWSWFAADQTVGFTRRRQVHEALIHRVDAELAAGVESLIDPELAADGLAEVLEVQFGGAPEWAEVSPEGPIGRVVCTDVDASWLVQVQSFSGTSPNTGTTYETEPVLAVVGERDGDLAFEISGTAADLDRWFWSRQPTGPIHRTGDTSVIESLVSEGMQ